MEGVVAAIESVAVVVIIIMEEEVVDTTHGNNWPPNWFVE